MTSTDYHAKYYAWALSRTSGRGVDRIGQALFDASVDLNPHQIDAALFALRSPLSKGVLLADEVGLGKTIEASLVLCQSWAERKRRLLVICPASLRKQWALELEEKFNLPSLILDAKSYRAAERSGQLNPFDQKAVILCSMHYANRKADEIKAVAWDLVVIDEAHKLRNAYRESNRIGRRIRWATDGRKKILLTATPLQNSLLELYGLATVIDENLFGDLTSFRNQFINNGGDLDALRDRLRGFAWRTLRRQVMEYVRYTERRLITRPFRPSEQEQALYEALSAYLQREESYALPKGQRHLLTLLVRKVLASSPYAVAQTLGKMQARLVQLREEVAAEATVMDRLLADDELDDDLLDQLLEDEEDLALDDGEGENGDKNGESKEAGGGKARLVDLAALDGEIADLGRFIGWAHGIGIDTKTRTLLSALEIGFGEMVKMGAAGKAVVFTESRRSQEFLKGFLEANGYAGQVVTFNGTNRDIDSTALYKAWLDKQASSGRVTGSRAVDVRTAIIDRFQQDARILIATEAAAEGINLQFCSLVINYDLPWNPQRIEQRIGRCHRYGQKHDVVVINFLNERNEADRRVYELLDQKFNLFTGVFGASDDVLGAIESGVDFERRILDIYQQCRTTEEIDAAFRRLQESLDGQIQSTMQKTRQLLMEHFDEDVHERLKVNLSGAQESLDRIGRLFWAVTRHELGQVADFDEAGLSFDLLTAPTQGVRPGHYHLISKQKENVPGEFLYRLSHPLGEYVLSEAAQHECVPAQVIFDITHHPRRISVVEQLTGQAGWLTLQHLTIDSFDREEYLLFSAFDDQGRNLDQESCERLFLCGGRVRALTDGVNGAGQRLRADADRHVQATIARSLEENNRHFNEARDQLDKWAEDMELAAQKELDDVKRQIRELQRRSRQAPTLAEQHDLQEQIRKLEGKKRSLRMKIFDIEDEIVERRDRLVRSLAERMEQKTQVRELFTIRWRVV